MNKIVKFDDVEGKVYELDDWKPEQGNQVKKYFNEKFKELRQNYNELIKDFNWNKIIFESEIMFVPVIGKIYYLYEKKDGKKFMSLVEPYSWEKNNSFKYIASFKQDSRQKWNLVDLNS
tara:strand:+ start:1965 stop:2321 length:357 start_codon:yes stop_codon:yes gene_type:complete